MPEVTDPELLAILNGSGPAPAASAYPGVIQGRPKTPNPMEAERLEMERERLRMAQESAAREAQKTEEGTESERTAGFLAGRITDAVNRLAPVGQKNREALSPEWDAEIARGVPIIGGDKLANAFTSSDRQIIEAAQLDILDAALTLGTGAAYNKEQLQGYAKSYLPQLNDSPAAIASKNAALRTLLMRARDKAGKAAPDIDQAIAALDALAVPPTNTAKPNPDADPDSLSYANPGMGGAGVVTDEGPQPPASPDNRPTSFAQGVGEGFMQAAGNATTYLERATGLETLGDILGVPTAAQIVRDRSAKAAAASDTRGSTGGRIVGNIIASIPTGAVANPVLGGALGGSLMATDPNSPKDIGINAALGAGVGKAVDVAAPYVAGALGKFLPGRGALSTIDREVVEAGQRQGILIRQPDARPELRGQYASTEATKYGGPTITAARTADAGAIEQRVAQVGGGRPFNSADNTAIGQSAQRVAERGNENVRAAADTLYKRVERAAPDFSVPPTRTAAFIDQKIAELEGLAPSGYTAEIEALTKMKSDLAKTGLSVATLQAQRKTVGGRITDNIADRSRADKTLTEVLDAAADELHSSLSAANPGAAAVLKRADAKWGQYKDLQREVTGLFLGKRGDATAETAARALNALVNGKGNYSALRRFMTLATPEEKADFSSTIAREWGTNSRGEFSPAAFAKGMENVSDRTLNALFGSNGRQALRDLQLISNAKTDAMSRMSPSGKAIAGQAGGLKRLLWGAMGLATGGADAAIASGAAQGIIARIGEQRAARMLLNPDFTKWLRQAPNSTDPTVINRYFARLSGISTVAANDNQALVRALVESVQKSPIPGIAAEEQQPKER